MTWISPRDAAVRAFPWGSKPGTSLAVKQVETGALSPYARAIARLSIIIHPNRAQARAKPITHPQMR